MQMQRTGDRSANALKKELVVRVEATSTARPETVYGLLADLSSHLVWAGERQAEKVRLLTIDAPKGPAVVGTEWRSTGSDPMGTFSDRSVVTEATRGRVFEFVTEARLTTKNGSPVDWTNVHRYELSPNGRGSRITYAIRIARVSATPGLLAAFNVPGIRALGLKAWSKVMRRTVRNLARVAEEREAGGR
jgi:hypothetical protein